VKAVADHTPAAIVLGDLDLAWPLRDLGVAVHLIAPAGSPARRTRTCGVGPPRPDPWRDPDGLVALIRSEARRLPVRPVIYAEDDGSLLVLSRQRELVEEAADQVLAPAAVVEALVDKAAFAEMAASLGLPVPETHVLHPGDDPGGVGGYPAIAKPITRPGSDWGDVGGGAKAVLVESLAELRQVTDAVHASQRSLIVQQYLPGPESLIESHHAYVCRDGRVAGEFTGRKVRTAPARFGYSSALVTTTAKDVTALGRAVIEATGLRGFVKTDVKRDRDGRLVILEVNPRPSLWLALGRAAGADLLAAAHADASGHDMPPMGLARSGASWWNPVLDLRACVDARAVRQWVAFGMGADVRSGIALRDPGPIMGEIAAIARSRVTRA
jgi:D-aspartate ligase